MRFQRGFYEVLKPIIFRLVGECEALNLVELKELALEMLQKYQRTEEQHYVTSYVQVAIRDYESWQFEREQVFFNAIKFMIIDLLGGSFET